MDGNTVSDPALKSLKFLSFVSYGIHTVVAVAAVLPGVQASVALLLVAVLIDAWKYEEAKGTWLESHFRFRLRTVIMAGMLYAVTSPLWILLFVPGWIAWTLVSIWFCFRIVQGFLRVLDERAFDQ
ncbi:MAG: hypothetical protein IT381_29345 [Deltaproteobacteria bacterium]|nr:hypothetical protein [Deltaproteobacteria bacterium]